MLIWISHAPSLGAHSNPNLIANYTIGGWLAQSSQLRPIWLPLMCSTFHVHCVPGFKDEQVCVCVNTCWRIWKKNFHQGNNKLTSVKETSNKQSTLLRNFTTVLHGRAGQNNPCYIYFNRQYFNILYHQGFNLKKLMPQTWL